MIIYYKDFPPVNIDKVKHIKLEDKTIEFWYEDLGTTPLPFKVWEVEESEEVYQMILERYCEKLEVIDRKPFCSECKYFRGLDGETEEIKCGHDSNMVLEDSPLRQTITEWKKCGKELNKDNKCNNFIRA